MIQNKSIKMRKLILLPLLFFQLSINLIAQENNRDKKISLELGIGYNTLSWNVNLPNENIKFNRNQFMVLPSFKVKYSYPILKNEANSKLMIIPFIGYNMFGGKSKEESSNYKDIFLLQSLELGILPSYSLRKKIDISFGFKGQYIFSAKQKTYGSPLDPVGASSEWRTHDVNDRFKDISFSIGTGISYRLKRISFGIETWFGITNINNFTPESIDISSFENNYRLIIGYTI